jgi:carotenoid cleavage dioxygenase
VNEDKPFHLQGNFAPVEEEITALRPEVVGSIPPELNGLYARNGANPVDGASEHWFTAPTPSMARPSTGSSATGWCTA